MKKYLKKKNTKKKTKKNITLLIVSTKNMIKNDDNIQKL